MKREVDYQDTQLDIQMNIEEFIEKNDLIGLDCSLIQNIVCVPNEF